MPVLSPPIFTGEWNNNHAIEWQDHLDDSTHIINSILPPEPRKDI